MLGTNVQGSEHKRNKCSWIKQAGYLRVGRKGTRVRNYRAGTFRAVYIHTNRQGLATKKYTSIYCNVFMLRYDHDLLLARTDYKPLDLGNIIYYSIVSRQIHM
jgi:hypothetical protein